MVTCGTKELYTALEKPSEHSSETMISFHPLLSAEHTYRPELTLRQLTEELCRNWNLQIRSRLLPQYTGEDPKSLASH